MENRKQIILLITAVITLLSACGPITLPAVQDEPNDLLIIGDSEHESFENPQDAWDPSAMYPTEDARIASLYPSWDRPKVNFDELNPPLDVLEPVEGRASISGLLYAYDISVPLADVEFIFVPAIILEGTPVVPPIITNGNPENGDIIGKADANGAFYLNSIEPGSYYLLINYPDHSEIAVETDNTLYNRLFEFEADRSYILGVIKILG